MSFNAMSSYSTMPVIQGFTNVFTRNALSNTKYKINQGGTRSSKTISDLQKVILKSHSKKITGKVFSVVSESMPHMRRTGLRDFKMLMQTYGLWERYRFNKTESTYEINGNIIEFFGCDDYKKVQSATRDYLLLIEAHNIKYETAYQMFMRTNIEITIEYNPVTRFWAHTKILDNPEYADMVTFIKSTYKDNPFLSKSIVQDILARAKVDPNFKRVYIDGEIGSLEGLIYPKFNIVKEMPENFDREFYGLDFGYSNSYTCLTHIRLANGQLFIQEIFYERGLTATKISDKMYELGISNEAEIVGDTSHKIIIDEMNEVFGWDILYAKKGPDSVEFGISSCQSYIINIVQTEEYPSINGIWEMRNYSYQPSKVNDGEYANKPIKKGDDFCDSFRYPIQTLLSEPDYAPAAAH